MTGELSSQGNLFSGDQLHLDYVGRDSFYGWLAMEGPRVFPDSAFKEFYVLDNSWRSVPPSQMIRMVLLQWFDKVSDHEAIEHAKFDLRWKVALGLEDHAGLCAKFTLQTFRGRLLLNEAGRDLLQRSVRACRGAGALQSRKVRVRAQQHSPEFRDAYRERQRVEHRLARMMQLGARQARYFGRAKTELQWLIAATVANLTLALGHWSLGTSQAPTVGGSQTLLKALKTLIQFAKEIWRSRSAKRHQTMCTA